MIFTFFKYLIIGVAYIPLIAFLVFFVFFVTTTRRKYWAGWVSLGIDRDGMATGAYLRKGKTLRWRAGVLSLNLGYPVEYDAEQLGPDKPKWLESRRRWLKKHGFKKECSWVPTGEARP